MPGGPGFTERALWLMIRRALLMIADAIERYWGCDQDSVSNK